MPVAATSCPLAAAPPHAAPAFFLLPQLDLTLAAEQPKADFQPPEVAAPSFDAPTRAATLAVALLDAAGGAGAAHLHGTNLASFRQEVRLSGRNDSVT